MTTPTNSEALPLTNCSPSDYDAGLLNDYGGGDVGWWQDYLRAEIGRANDYWRNQYITAHVVAVDAIREGERVLEAREKYFAMRDLSNNATELAEKYKQERDKAREALTLATSEIVEQTFELRQQLGKAREALQKVASLAYGNADKTVCLIHLNAIRRIAVAALKHEEDAK